MSTPLRLDTRGSRQALGQARAVAGAIEAATGTAVEFVLIETTGDQRVDVPLHSIGGQGVFVKEVQRAVLDGTADMTIATLPAQITAGGGRGLVVGLARRGIEHLTGFRAVQPLSGMRCMGPAAFEAASPLARGWGVETALTIDVLRAGLTVLEVPCELQHRVSGRDWRGQVHRAEQYRDVWLALVRRGWRPWHRG